MKNVILWNIFFAIGCSYVSKTINIQKRKQNMKHTKDRYKLIYYLSLIFYKFWKIKIKESFKLIKCNFLNFF